MEDHCWQEYIYELRPGMRNVLQLQRATRVSYYPGLPVREVIGSLTQIMIVTRAIIGPQHQRGALDFYHPSCESRGHEADAINEDLKNR